MNHVLHVAAIVQIRHDTEGRAYYRRKLAGGKRVDAVEDVLSVGQKIQVEIAEIQDRGKLSLIPVVEDDADAGAADNESGDSEE